MRMFAMIDRPESLFKPSLLLRYLAHKALDLSPGPLRNLLAGVLRPWGIGVQGGAIGVGCGGGVGRSSGKEAALAKLMGWPTA